MKDNFFPKVTLSGNKLLLNDEAIETMDLDIENPKVLLMEINNPDKPKSPKEIVMIKTNGSLCDDVESVKESFDPTKIKTVTIEYEEDTPVLGSVDLNDKILEVLNADLGDDKKEFKLLCVNTESPVIKEFKDQWDIKNSYYRFVYLNDKRSSIGKDKNVEIKEERIKL
jgi:hypothetical protein